MVRANLNGGGVLLVAVLLNVIPGFFENSMPEILFKLYQQTVFPYLSIFLFAAFIAEHENKLKRPLNCFVLYVVLAIGLPVDFTGAGYAIVRSALVTIFAIAFGNTVKCGLLKKDVSYEIYLVHMPIANIFVELLKQQSWVTLVMTIVIAIVIAYMLYCLNNTMIRKMENN